MHRVPTWQATRTLGPAASRDGVTEGRRKLREGRRHLPLSPPSAVNAEFLLQRLPTAITQSVSTPTSPAVFA